MAGAAAGLGHKVGRQHADGPVSPLKPGGRTAFRSDSNGNVLTHPAQARALQRPQLRPDQVGAPGETQPCSRHFLRASSSYRHRLTPPPCCVRRRCLSGLIKTSKCPFVLAVAVSITDHGRVRSGWAWWPSSSASRCSPSWSTGRAPPARPRTR